MGRLACALFLISTMIAPTLAAGEDVGPRRVALVVGNGAYQVLDAELINPPNDARAIAEKLEWLGFDVVTAIDRDYRGMRESLSLFAEKLRGADAGLFYYAGHGMEYQGRNYLFPIDAQLRNESDVYIGLMEVDQILRVMETAVPVRLVFLDACRDNPLARSFRGAIGMSRSASVGRGLAPTDAAVGTFIAYATAPGQVAEDGRGDNSPFTSAMLEHLNEPGVDIGEMMRKVRQQVLEMTQARQTPWESSSLLGSFILNLHVTIEQPAPAPTPTPTPDASQQGEIVFWQSVESSRSPAAYAAYLERFGEAGLFAPLAKARLAELTPPSDAQSTPSTPPAVAQEPAPTLAPPVISAEATPVVPPRLEAAPTIEPPPPIVAPEIAELALVLTASDWREVQSSLEALGFDAGGVDGRPGSKTRAAIAAWQAAAGLAQTGYLDEASREQLLATAGPTLAALEVARPPTAPSPSGVIRDCADCPELVAVPAGSFRLGSPDNEPGRRVEEGPQRSITLARGFAIGRYEVSNREWQACVRGGGCPALQSSGGSNQPVSGVGFTDAGRYVEWLSRLTGKRYALPSEAQWEYAARGGTSGAYFWGSAAGSRRAVCADCGTTYDLVGSAPVGSFAANGFGLFDTSGNVWEWVADCWNERHDGVPSDGRARTDGNCRKHVLKGGSYSSRPHAIRSASRIGDLADREPTHGLRVLRPLD